MKKLIAWLLLLTLTVGLFAGCRKTEADPTEPGVTVSEADIEGITAAIDYLKSFYKDEGSETPVDYERFGIVRIGGVPYTVVWTVDVSEDLIKIVVNDDGTVTIDVNEECEEDTPYVLTATVTDAAGNSVSHSWNHILPKAVDMVAIVKAAYALKPGESLPYESTLRGKITQVKTPYSEEYKNITVIIEVEGAEDMPIECYRLKGEGAEDLQVGDIITVTGTLKNYNGTIEFDAGCMLVAVVPGERVQAPDDMKQIVDEAYALGANKTLPYEATLTGEIIEIGTPYDSYYGNISVTIVVEGREDKPIVCYRMKGKGCENLKVTDVITVKGYITNYVGDKGYSTIEFTAGCQLLDYKPGAGVYAPTDPAEIMRIAKALGANKKTKFEATLTGVITEVNSPYSSQYGNVSVTMDVNGTNDEIYCYRIKGNGADKINVGDTITVKGYITNYVGDSGKSTIEFVAGSKLISYKKGVKEELPSYKNNIVDAPVVGTAYKMGLEQKNNAGSPWYYFTGKLANDFYLGTSEDGRKAVDVFIGAVSGGYSLYFKDASGKTQYINIIETTGTDGKLHVNMQIADKATSVYTLDAEKKILTTKIGDTPYCIGTYNNYTTMAARKVSGIEMPAYLLTLEALTGPASMEEAAKKLEKDYPDGYDADKKLPTELKIRDDKFTITWKLETTNEAAVKIKDGVVVETQQQQAVNYKLTATITKVGTTETITVTFDHKLAPLPKDFVENPVAGTAYKMGMYTTTGILLFNGKTESASVNYRLATVDDSTKAANVYLEAVSGGFLLYFMDGDVKTYINIYEKDDGDPGYGKGSIELVTEKPTNVLKYDKATNTLVYTAPDGENSYFMGTYSTYTTFSVSNYSYIEGDKAANIDISQFPARFYPENIKVEPAPVIEPDKEVLTIAEAIEFGLSKDHNTYSQNKYKVTGVITEVYNADYGNMYIADADGNKLTIYGTYDATGEVSYKDMAVKPVAGDTVTIYGNVGQYGGTAQIKNGWIVDHVAVNPPTTEPGTTEPDTTEPSDSSYVKITSAEEFVSGTYVLVAGNGYAPGVVDGTWVTAVQPTVSGDAVTNAAGGVWTLTVSGNSVTLKDANGVFVGTSDDDRNNISTGEYAWTWAFAEGKFTFASTGSTLKYFTSNGSTGEYSVGNKFRGYKESTVTGSHAAEYFYKFDLYLLSEGSGETPTEPTTTEPTTTEPTTTAPTEPVGDSYQVVDEPVVGTAYKFGMVQGNLNKTYYLNGQMDSYYMATVEDAATAVDVYLEAADGGYYLYTNVDGAKKYINMVVSDGHVNGAFEDAASTVYTIDEEHKTVEAVVNEEVYWFATRNDRNYTTLGPAKKSYNGFYGQFYALSSEPETTEPTTTEPTTTAPSEPATTEPSGNGSYVKITSAEEFVSGTYVLVAGNGYAPGVVDGTWVTAVQPTVSGNAVTDPAGGVWTLTVNGNSVTLKDANGVFVGTADDDRNNISTVEYAWTWVFAEGKFTFASTGSTLKYFTSNGSTGEYSVGNKFRGYKDTTVNGSHADEYFYKFDLYKLDETATPETTEPTTTEPVTEPATEPATEPSGSGYVKITSEAELVSGTYVLVAGNGYAPGVVDGTWVTAVQPTVSGNAVTDPAGGVWTLTVNGNSVTLKDANGVFVGTADDDRNNISTVEYAWTWAFAEGKFTFASTGSTLKYFTSNGSTGEYSVGNKFRGYKDTTVNGSHADEYFYKFDLYKLDETATPDTTEPTTTEPAPSEPATTVPQETEPGAGEPETPALSTPEEIVNAAYALEEGAVLEGTYTLTGVITSVDYAYNAENNNITVTMQIGDLTNKPIKCYKLAGTGVDQIGKGDTITVTGTLKNYYGTIEFDSGCTLDSFDINEEYEEVGTTYLFSSYNSGVQYAEETHELDENVKLHISKCHLNGELRIYSSTSNNGVAIITSEKAINSLSFNAGHKVDTLNVYGSNDGGSTWELIQAVSISDTSYLNYTVNMNNKTYTSLKFDVAGSNQIRLQSMTLTFAE